MRTTTTTKTARTAPRTAQAAVRRVTVMSDRRYYVQCAYRLAMAVLFLIALAVSHHH